MERNSRDIESGFYTFDIDSVRTNFSEWKNIKIIVGAIPETLPAIKSKRVAFLHLDLNCSPPEVAAIEALWDRCWCRARSFCLMITPIQDIDRKKSEWDPLPSHMPYPYCRCPPGRD